jgi:Zn finger protein HypA/HybF involved in hydrogenase expression
MVTTFDMCTCAECGHTEQFPILGKYPQIYTVCPKCGARDSEFARDRAEVIKEIAHETKEAPNERP